MNAHEQTNAALARWVGWKLWDKAWHEPGNLHLPYNNDPTHAYYFNPMQRLDHAWMCMEYGKIKMTTNQRRSFLTRLAQIVAGDPLAEDAARMICEAIIEIAGTEV